MNRRSFVRTSLGVAGATLMAGGPIGCDALSPPPGAFDTPALLGTMGTERILRIGQAYLKATAAEQSAVHLHDAIQQALAPWPWSTPTAVADRIIDDFEQGRTVLADGWMLSVTEARQCALFTLARG